MSTLDDDDLLSYIDDSAVSFDLAATIATCVENQSSLPQHAATAGASAHCGSDARNSDSHTEPESELGISPHVEVIGLHAQGCLPMSAKTTFQAIVVSTGSCFRKV